MMFDEIPLKTRLTFWFERNSALLKAWAFPAAAAATALAYWPVREMLAGQEVRVTVIHSTLTVTYLVSLFCIGWGLDILTKRFLAKRHRVVRELAWVAGIAVLFVYLDLTGYGVKFL